MRFKNKKVFISGAAREFGRSLAFHFAKQGAELFLTVRGEQKREEALHFFHSRFSQPVHVYNCDLTIPANIQETASGLGEETNYVDIIINNAAMWLQGELAEASDEDIANTIQSGLTGNLLLLKHLEALLLNSSCPDIVNMISVCGTSNYSHSRAHAAFFAMKHGQSGLSHILTKRLKHKRVRVISLYPPDFQNMQIGNKQRTPQSEAGFGTYLRSRELIDTIDFALTRPRSCMMNQIYFEDTREVV